MKNKFQVRLFKSNIIQGHPHLKTLPLKISYKKCHLHPFDLSFIVILRKHIDFLKVIDLFIRSKVLCTNQNENTK